MSSLTTDLTVDAQIFSKAEDTRGRNPAPIFGVENRNRLSERVSCKNDSENRRRFSTPTRTCSISRSIFGSTWSIETVVIGLSSLFLFGLFVNSSESVNKHFDYIFYCFCYALQLYEWIIAAATVSSALFRPCLFSTPCVCSLSTETRCCWMHYKTIRNPKIIYQCPE